MTRLRIDAERCTGHNRCAGYLDGLAEYDSSGYAKVIGDGQLSGPQVSAADLAAANCPERAISVEYDR